EIQVSYAIGVAEPTSVTVETFGTEKVPVETIERIVADEFDLRPYFIIKELELIQPMYLPLASYGHMGREDLGVRWEDTDRVEALRAAAGL
ncbi:MAG: methionine adenosyltransferase domain-containing protein, partial [Lysobacterales bacterium]